MIDYYNNPDKLMMLNRQGYALLVRFARSADASTMAFLRGALHEQQQIRDQAIAEGAMQVFVAGLGVGDFNTVYRQVEKAIKQSDDLCVNCGWWGNDDLHCQECRKCNVPGICRDCERGENQ